MCREDAKTALRSFRVYVVQILERGIENQLHEQSSCTLLLNLRISQASTYSNNVTWIHWERGTICEKYVCCAIHRFVLWGLVTETRKNENTTWPLKM